MSPRHLIRKNPAEVTAAMIFILVIAGSAFLIYQTFMLREQLTLLYSTAAANATISPHQPFRTTLTPDTASALQQILWTSAALIILLFSLSAILFWYATRRRAQLARAAAIMKKSHDRYRFLTEGPPTIGIIRFSLVDGRVMDCNRAALNITGVPRADFVGRPVTDFIDSRDSDYVKRELQELRAGRPNHYFTVRMPEFHGGTRVMAWHISVLKFLDEEPQAVAILTDVSREHELQLERIEKERLAGVLEMAGAAAHELNQPMQVVSGKLWMLLQKTDTADPAYRTLKTLHAEIERMTAISRKIASISSYEVKDYVGKTRIIDIDRASG